MLSSYIYFIVITNFFFYMINLNRKEIRYFLKVIINDIYRIYFVTYLYLLFINFKYTSPHRVGPCQQYNITNYQPKTKSPHALYKRNTKKYYPQRKNT